jgi:hypothetical protein
LGRFWAAPEEERRKGELGCQSNSVKELFFFYKTLFSFVFSKPFANLVAVLKLFENSNLLKIFKCLWNL